MLHCSTHRLLVSKFTIQWCPQSAQHIVDVSTVLLWKLAFQQNDARVKCPMHKVAVYLCMTSSLHHDLRLSEITASVVSWFFSNRHSKELCISSHKSPTRKKTVWINHQPHRHTSVSAVGVLQSQCHAVLTWVKPSWSDLLWRPSSHFTHPARSQMELKVWVDGVVRVVCGLSEETSCQDVVIALAQAIGEYLKLWNHCVLLSIPAFMLLLVICLLDSLSEDLNLYNQILHVDMNRIFRKGKPYDAVAFNNITQIQGSSPSMSEAACQVIREGLS